MRDINKSLLTVLLAMPLFAQTNPADRLRDAIVLEQQGQFDQAIMKAKLLTDSHQLTGVILGRACIALGVAYREGGEFTEAQEAFERSLRIFERDPNHLSDYAAALQNYGMLYNDTGQFEVAEKMWQKALHLRQQIGDLAAVARSLIHLAELALAQSNVHRAKEYLKQAAAEMKLTNDLSDDDLALFFEAQGWLAIGEKQPSDAADAYRHALEISERTRGERHWLTGWDHMLLGTAYVKAGDVDQALIDMRLGLEIMQQVLGRRHPRCAVAQLAYAQVLNRIGSHNEAAQLRGEAEQTTKEFQASQCVGCTISLVALR